MRKLVVLTFVSMDGVMQAPGGQGEDESGKFAYGGWVVPYFDETLGAAMGEQMGKPFDLLLGRKTYDIFASYWPHTTEPGAEPLNDAHKYVASRSNPNLSWGPATLLTGDVPAQVQALKAQEGRELQVHGSADFLQTLLKHDLVDELWLKIFPVTLGGGKRLFGDGVRPGAYKLLSSTTSPSGVVIASYARDGAVKTGTFG